MVRYQPIECLQITKKLSSNIVDSFSQEPFSRYIIKAFVAGVKRHIEHPFVWALRYLDKAQDES